MKQSTIILLCVLLLTTSCANNKYKDDDFDMYLDWSGYWYYQGEQNYEAYRRALHEAERALDEEPDNLMAKLIYGYSMLKLGIWESDNPRKQSAKRVFTEIIQEEPDNYRARLGLGITNIKLCKLYSGKLRDFQRLIESADFLKNKISEADKLAKEEKDITNIELLIANGSKEWFEMIRLVVKGEIFPYSEYKSLVKKEEPELSDIQQALGNRIEELIKSIDDAMMNYPFDHKVYSANVDKLKILFQIAEKHYKKEYSSLIDNAEAEFNHCLNLHDKFQRVYFWVYDYLSYLYGIKATLIPENEKLVREYHELQRDYMIKFITEDKNFERKRRKKITSDEIVELEDNPFYADVTKDYQSKMIQLIDTARELRQNRIIMLITLLADYFKDYVQAMKWIEELKLTEERLSNPDVFEPFLYYYYRAKIYYIKALELEKKHPALANFAYATKQEREEVPAETIDAHHLIWEQVIDNSYNFLKRASIARQNIERDEIDDILLDSMNRYPELYRYPDDN